MKKAKHKMKTEILLYLLVLNLILLGSILIMIGANPTPDLRTDVSEIGQLKFYPNSTPDYSTLIKDRDLNKSIIELIKDIADNVSNHEYKLNEYDCTQFSEELVSRLKKIGIKSECISGYYNYSIPHTWVKVYVNNSEIYIEATGGYIIEDREYKNYETKWEGLCW